MISNKYCSIIVSPPAMKLNSIVKLDKLLSLDGDAIAKIWMARVAGGGNGEAFAMTLPSKTALEIQRTSRRYPSVSECV